VKRKRKEAGERKMRTGQRNAHFLTKISSPLTRISRLHHHHFHNHGFSHLNATTMYTLHLSAVSLITLYRSIRCIRTMCQQWIDAGCRN
jgi:hypothetical protein